MSSSAKVELTTWQHLIASHKLVIGFSNVLMIGGAIVAVILSGSYAYALSSIWTGCLTLVIAVLGLLIGRMAAGPTAWVIFGPMYMTQEEHNGGPFKKGDVVQVIAPGYYFGQVGEVYDFAQYERPRVRLSESAEEAYEDIFLGAQLVLVERKP